MLRTKKIARFFILLAAILLLVSLRFVYAQTQNTGSAPYRDSEHSYRVPIGDAANPRAWIITDGTVQHIIKDDKSPVALPSWADTIQTGSGANQAGVGFHGVKIYFDHTAFLADDWTLEYYEYLDHGGTYECVSARSFAISLSTNTFWLLVSTPEIDRQGGVAGTQIYNSQHNKIRSITQLEGISDSTTQLTYTITMTKNDDFDPTYWQFDANFPVGEEVESFNAEVTSANGGLALTTTNTAGADYTVVITPHLSNVSSVIVTITVVYAHDMLSDVTRNLDITNGFAVLESPPAPDAVTDDNITTYPIGNAGVRTQAITILAIPATRDITFDNSINTNENTTSAQNPLLNSIHYYKVTMGDVNNNTGVWHLVNSSNVTVATEADNITATTNLTDGLATIYFPEALPTGLYTLYFTETDATRGTITIREYPVAIAPKLEVVLAATGDQCATANGVVYQNLGLTETNIDYTISLADTDPDPVDESYYAFAWSFDFGVGSNPGFDIADVVISAIETTNGAGVSLSGSGNSRTVNVEAGSTIVTIRVTFSGYYDNSHDLTISVNGVTGTYNEVADDETDTHLIYAMPQALAIEGID